MFTLTESAREHLQSLLHEIGAGRNVALRIVIEGVSLSLQPDIPNPEDAVYTDGQRPLVVVDPDVLNTFLEGRTLDIQEVEGEKHITLS